MKKFTGNDDIGDALDHMTKAIHAFAHFSVVYSQNNILLCDLQGAPDFNGKMCLIDPQAHTEESSRQKNVPVPYWDGGRRKINEFLKQHSPACRKNWICSALGLQDILVQPASPKKLTATSENPRNRLSYITHPSPSGSEST